MTRWPPRSACSRSGSRPLTSRPRQAKATITRLHAAIAEAKAVGDLDGLKRRLDALSERADSARQEHKAARDRARVEAIEVKERIVAEAEKLAAEATHWKSSGDRLKELLDEWKAAPHGDRQAEAALWKRMSAARSAFAKRRKGYFAALEEEREGVRERKQELVTAGRGALLARPTGPRRRPPTAS